jgi:hypothetical protein
VATFESSWPSTGWVRQATPAGTRSTAAAHDGSWGLIDPGWHYNLGASTGLVGHKLQVWTRKTTGSGRTYLGFAATSGGAYSFVFASNTNNIILQRNSGWGYADLTSRSMSFVANRWYLMQVEFLSSGRVTATLFDSNGTTALGSLTYTIGTTTGGVAIRGFNSHHIDTIRICK